MKSAATRERGAADRKPSQGARPEANMRRTDPALAANLQEIVSQCFEAGASVAYVMHDPPSVVLRDAGDEALPVDQAGTALLVLFAQRSSGATSVTGRYAPYQGSSSWLGAARRSCPS